MTTKKHDPVRAQPEDPPWWRLVFLVVQGPHGQWWRGFALIGLLLVGMLAALLVFAGGAGGALGVGSLAVAWRGRHRLGRR
ncbi:MAG: hypothetical protein ABIZ05_18020 [Pseudonocardiaceae bacterium]